MTHRTTPMASPARSRIRPALLCVLFGAAASSIYACNQAWDEYDPRLGSTASGTSSASGSSTSSTSTSSSSTSSGEVDGSACSAGAPCYTGAGGTVGVGACAYGQAVCTDASVSCANEVTPTVDDECTTLGDFDCDGANNDHCGVWGVGFASVGVNSSNQAYGMAVSPGGHVFVTGGMRGHLYATEGDAGVSLAAGVDGMFTLELDTPPVPTAVRYGGFDCAGMAVALDGDGGALLTGVLYNGQTLQGPPPLAPLADTATGFNFGLFLVRLAGGVGIWQEAYESAPVVSAPTQSNAVAFGAGATAYVGGAFQGNLSFGPDAGLDADAGASGLVFKLDTGAGASEWQTRIGNVASIYTVAAAPQAGLVLAGGTYSDANLVLAGHTFPGTTAGSGILLELSGATGQPQWGRSYTSTAQVRVDSIAVDSNAAEAVVAGRFAGTVAFGGAAVELGASGTPDAGAADAGTGCGSVTAIGPADVFVTRVRLADLSCVWVKTFGNVGGLNGPGWSTDGFAQRTQDFGPQVVVDGTGAAVVAANFAGSLTVEGWTITAPGSSSIALLKLGTAGDVAWIRRFGEAGAYATAIGADSTNDVYLAGEFTDSLKIAPGVTLTAPLPVSHGAMFVARIAH